MFFDESDRRGEFGSGRRADVAVEINRAAGTAAEDVPAAVSVPIDDDRRGVSVGNLHVFAVGLDLEIRAGKFGLRSRPFVEKDANRAVEAADE